MSFAVNVHGPPNGMMMQHGGYGSFGDVNGHAPQLVQKPQIYTAIYSGVSVYEMEVNRVAVMRRRSDSWLNATQILKVAGIDKGKRTKVLEKEILRGEHEKVQGGYGKYQGTWIRYDRGVQFCRQYGVEEILRPLLEYDMGQDGITIAGQGGVDTPTKEQAMAAQRKRMYNAGLENRPTTQSTSGTFFKNISSTASNAIAAISKARFDSPAPAVGTSLHRSTSARRPSQHGQGSQESTFPGGSQQSMMSMASESSNGVNGNSDSGYGTQTAPYMAAIPEQIQQGEVQEPPRKRIRPSSDQDVFMRNAEGPYDASMEDTPTEPNESFVYHQNGVSPLVEEGILGLQPLPKPKTPAGEEKARLLTSLFLDPSQADYSTHPALVRLSGEDLDTPLDVTAHTALHWAATLARLPLLKALIARGASIYRVNGGGETALMRACLVKNNLDQGSFPELLELLGPTIEMRDGRGRTVLHHIAVSSAVKGRSAASKYYLESLLEFVVRQGATSQHSSFNGNAHPSAAPETIKTLGLARFMSEIVNAQDKAGDTALNLAARIGIRSIISQLLEVKADATIPNRGGLRPIDFGVGGEADVMNQQHPEYHLGEPREKPAISRVVGETSRDIMSSISDLLTHTSSQFAAEMAQKQSLIDNAHASLRARSAALADARRALDAVKQRSTARDDLKQKILNLRRAKEEQKARLGMDGHAGGGTGGANGGDDDEETIRVGSGGGDAGDIKVEIGFADQDMDIPDFDPDPDHDLHHFDLDDQHDKTNHLGLHPSTHHIPSENLPPTPLLRARTAAYRTNNQNLREYNAQLRSRSRDLESKFRRVVALCTGAPEEKVEELLGSLVLAVESEGGAGGDGVDGDVRGGRGMQLDREGDVGRGRSGDGGGGGGGGAGSGAARTARTGGGGWDDVGRVREFLRRVEEVGAE
ncbi:MAG: hypothetical protein M1819_003436 [Sarea resinae]|nr:MAG: hypothetical protein M1819_003436 [Sarea resinae]